MAHLWKKSLLLATLSVLPTFALTSCAGVSQYGTVTSITYHFTTNGDNKNTDDFTNLSSNTYGYDILNGDSAINYQQNGDNWQEKTVGGYVNSLSSEIIGIGKFVQDLVRASLVGFKNDSTYNEIFNANPQSDEKFLQFLYAASNLLNFGESGQIGFGLKSIQTTISDFINPQIGGKVQVVNNPNDSNVSDDGKKTEYELGYTSDATLTFSFTYGYWHIDDNSPMTNGNVTANDVKNYVEKYNVWSPQKFDTYYSSFTINLNLQARIQAIFKMDSDSDIVKNYTWNNGKNLENKDGSDYTLSQSDISTYFKINNDSNFDSFNLQFEPSTVSNNQGTFLNEFGTYDSTTSFGYISNGDNGVTYNVPDYVSNSTNPGSWTKDGKSWTTFVGLSSSLDNILSGLSNNYNDTKNYFSDYTGVLKFVDQP